MGVLIMASAKAKRPIVTVITPVFNETGNLARYEQSVSETLLQCPDIDFRVLFVDDGSSDGSWKMIQEMCARDSRFQGMRLSRNFGPHAALCAGLQHADGDAVAILACDLQDPPDVVLDFVARWRQGAKIVWGKRRTRTDSWWRKKASAFFEGMLRRYAMPPGSLFTTGSFLLMDRKVLECYKKFQEGNRITFALVAWTGFDQAVVEYDRKARQAGKSSWGLSRLVKAAYDAFLSFSRVPFGALTALGVGLFLCSIVLSIYLVLCYISGDPKPGWVSIMLVLSFFFGMHFVFMSVQGEYLARIYSESVRRPMYLISDQTAPDAAEEPTREAA
ncbi:MAG: glycosyltransferase family 2 protein [Gemmataceae bacterium]